MYYIAGVNQDGSEEGCDFGFDMVERIVLDYCLKELPRGQARDLVGEKRFTYYGKERRWQPEDMVGLSAGVVQFKYRIPLHWENCFATVVSRDQLLVALKRIRIKVDNQKRWQCGGQQEGYGFFDHIVTFEPDRLRSMLSTRKYGDWDCSKDRIIALLVLSKFIDFLQARTDVNKVILFDDIFCTRLDATAQIKFNNKGTVTGFKYLDPNDIQVYRWTPRLDVWHRS